MLAQAKNLSATRRDRKENPGYYVGVVAGSAAIPLGAVTVVGGVILGVFGIGAGIYDKVKSQ